jgi:hypothetical protein
MRKLRRLTLAVVLAMLLAPSALAGITDTPPAPQSPPEPASVTAPTPTDENTQDVPVAPSDPLTDVALTLLQGLLTVF